MKKKVTIEELEHEAFKLLQEKKFKIRNQLLIYVAREHFKLTFEEIGLLLDQDPKNVWSTFQRAKKNIQE